VCARVGNQRSHGVVTARVRTDAVQSLHHQRRDLHQSTYPIPLGRSGLILLSGGLLPFTAGEGGWKRLAQVAAGGGETGGVAEQRRLWSEYGRHG
jgi:hypothetical protein